MSADRGLVVETVRQILGSHQPFVLTSERPWDPGLWSALVQGGLTGVGVPEEAGGSGGEVADAAAVVRTLAAGAAAVPVAEQLLVAGPALLGAGLPVPAVDEPLSVAVDGAVTADPADGGWTLTGTAVDVPWAGVARHLAVLAAGPDGPVLASVAVGDLEATDARNLAGEPRGSLIFDGTTATAAALPQARADEVRARYALARAVQLAGALEQVLGWTVQYAGERRQFGRPLAKFQAIQMELAEMAGEVTAVSALTDAAVQSLGRRAADVVLAAAAAKVRAGTAVEVVARRAHQLHGAIGFTQGHRLHHLTRRCWSWRDEAGGELYWSRVLGAGLLADGGDGLWPALTRVV